jgi:hypothetical protein
VSVEGSGLVPWLAAGSRFPDGKKGTNGTGKCVVGCPAGLAPGPGGCGRKCTTDADCAKPTESCSNCKKCKLVTDPPRGKICQI